MLKKTALAIAATAMLVTTGVAVEAKTLKVQASSKAGDWAHRFMTDKWAPKLKTMTSGKIGIDVLPTKSVVPHRETIDAVANGILDGDLNAVSYFSGRDPAFAIIGDLIAGTLSTRCARFANTAAAKRSCKNSMTNTPRAGCMWSGAAPMPRKPLCRPCQSAASLTLKA